MKRPLVLVLLTLLTLVMASPALAAPNLQEARPVIAQPAQDSAVRGVVQIVGSATHPQFQRYELYYAPWPVPSDQSWIFIGDAHFSQQPLGLLGTWDSRSVTDGAYALRVRVVKQDSNYIDSDPRRVLVTNTRPVETPTPEVTDTPEPSPTEAPATPTIVVAVPTSAKQATAAAAATPTGTPQPNTTPILATTQDGDTGSSVVGSITDQLFDVQRLMDSAKRAAMYTAAGFLAVGLFFGVKALLVWLWQKIRP